MFESANQFPSSIDGDFLGKPARKSVGQFSYLISGVLLLIAIYSIYYSGVSLTSISLIVASVGVLGLWFKSPSTLFPLWRLWMTLGLVLNKFVAPVVLFLMWCIVVVPIAWFVKSIGIKVLDTSFKPGEDVSYWVDRTEKDNDFSKLNRQF